jgi:MFS transporter, DHA3 family, macrolide efflux protein
MPRMRTFYVLLLTQGLSLIGSRMTVIGIGIWLYSTTKTTTPLLLMAFFNELAAVFAGSLAGVLVDRWPRRRVLILADAGQALGTVVLLAAFLSGRFAVWQLYAIVFVQGIFALFQGPAKDAAVTMLVPAGRRERANAVQEMVFPMAGVVAPALAGVAYAAGGIATVVAVDMVSFVIAIVVVAVLHIPDPEATPEGLAIQGRPWQQVAGALRFLRQRRGLLLLVLYGAALNFFLNGPLELTIPYLLAATGSEPLMGSVMALQSAGAFAGAALIAVWGGGRARVPTMLGGYLLTGVMFLLFGTVRQPLLLGAVVFLLMAPLPMGNALFVSLLQSRTPPDAQGRIFALVNQLGFVGATGSFLLVGPLVDKLLVPAASRPGWSVVAPLVGRGEAGAIGLVLVVTGVLILATTLLLYARRSVRYVEVGLPDYEVASEL